MNALDDLAGQPWHYGFHAALRLIERLHPNAPGLGRSVRPQQDPVRLGQDPSLRFHPSELSAFARGEGGGPDRLTVAFFGLFGPNGPLPTHLTEIAYDRQRNAGDRTFVAFADLFHHRLLSLFHRAYAQARPVVQRERGRDDGYARRLAATLGMATPSLRDADDVEDETKLFHAGILATATRCADGLRRMLAADFGLPTRIVPFVGRWIDVPNDARCTLGASTATLGRDAVLGRRCFDRRQTFRVEFGPLSLADYVRLLPGSDWNRRLHSLVTFYVGHELVHETRLVLRADQVPPLTLDGTRALGWTTWATARRRSADVALTLHPTQTGSSR